LPETVDIPTGLGKTATIALWLSALAIDVVLPRRLIYVVDRRTVVDQATAEADALASVLGDGKIPNTTIDALRDGLGLRRGQRLPVSTLRGQHFDNRQWLENPASPAIVIGTVDMIGSRLLFEGYGVSPRMRPVHAGLVGADTLVMLDEAHLAPPFEGLLRAIANLPATAPVPGFHLIALSATGKRSDSAFSLEPNDWEDAPVRTRLNARKRVLLQPIVEAEALAERLANRAWELGNGGKRVVVYCNRRKIAQEVCGKLGTFAKLKGWGTVTEMLVGARRVREREELKSSEIFARFAPEGASGTPDGSRPAFLVATSAGEVGVDLDADHMVCDLVPWERMVQRFGRVNRSGRAETSVIEVFPAAAESEVEAEIGSDRLAVLRAPFASEAWPVGADGRRDASPGSLYRLRDDPELRPLTEAATTEEPLRPALTKALVEAWSMTSLSLHPGRPDVEPWLRGWVKEDPQTRVVWRRLLPTRPDDETDARKKILDDFFQNAPPHLGEILESLTSEVVDTLQKRAKALAAAPDEGAIGDHARAIAVILSRRNEVEEVLSLGDLAGLPAAQLRGRLAGRTIVLNARLGALSDAGLLDAKAEPMPTTLDAQEADTWDRNLLRAAGYRVRQVPADREPDRDWPVEWRWRIGFDDDSEDGEEIRVEVWRHGGATRGDAAIGKREQRLAEHHDWTAFEAGAIARRLALPEKYRKMLVAAAAVHDAGKARDLWQRAMRAPRNGRPYAKTRGGGIPRLLQMNGESYRHEFGSLRDAESNTAIDAMPEELRDLALHLVAAHHGFARPVIAAVDPDHAPSASAELARSAALRFARLQVRWGPWGLAWWEALLRAADWAASRELNERAAED
jgi:CRISPR-associated endonuclease/helicase Cas3